MRNSVQTFLAYFFREPIGAAPRDRGRLRQRLASCDPSGGEKLLDPKASGHKGEDREIRPQNVEFVFLSSALTTPSTLSYSKYMLWRLKL